ncbi:hypothetical protein BC936DRAFT_142463, partial [Jimgerdemannia flammicorona]
LLPRDRNWQVQTEVLQPRGHITVVRETTSLTYYPRRYVGNVRFNTTFPPQRRSRFRQHPQPSCRDIC